MPLFRRERGEQLDDLGALILQGHDMIQQTGRAHSQRWGLGSALRWDLDQVTGQLRFTFDDCVAEAPVQVIGTYGYATGSWMWAWANTSLEPALCTASERTRAWGEQRGHVMLTTARFEASEEQAGDLAALGFRLFGSSGFYRAPAGRSDLHLAFGTVTIISAEGAREDFSIDVEQVRPPQLAEWADRPR